LILKLNDDVDRYKKELKDKQKELEDLRDDLSFERSEKTKKIKLSETLKKQLHSTEADLLDRSEDLEGKRNKIDELQRVVQAARDAEPENEATRRKLRAAQNKITNIEMEMDRKERNHKNKLDDLNSEIKNLKRSLIDEQRQVKDLNDNKKELLRQMASENTPVAVVEHYEQQVTKYEIIAQKAKKEGQAKYDLLSKKHAQSTETIKRLEEALRNALGKQDKFTKVIKDLRGQVGHLSRKNERANSLISDSTIE